MQNIETPAARIRVCAREGNGHGQLQQPKPSGIRQGRWHLKSRSKWLRARVSAVRQRRAGFRTKISRERSSALRRRSRLPGAGQKLLRRGSRLPGAEQKRLWRGSRLPGAEQKFLRRGSRLFLRRANGLWRQPHGRLIGCAAFGRQLSGFLAKRCRLRPKLRGQRLWRFFRLQRRAAKKEKKAAL